MLTAATTQNRHALVLRYIYIRVERRVVGFMVCVENQSQAQGSAPRYPTRVAHGKEQKFKTAAHEACHYKNRSNELSELTPSLHWWTDTQAGPPNAILALKGVLIWVLAWNF